MSSPKILQLPASVAKLVYRTTTRTWQFFRDAKVHRHDQKGSQEG